MVDVPSGMTPEQLTSMIQRFEVRKGQARDRRVKLSWALRGEIDKFDSVKEAVYWMKRAEQQRERAERDEGFAERFREIEEEEDV